VSQYACSSRVHQSLEPSHQERVQAAQALGVMTSRQLNAHAIVQHLNAMTSTLFFCCLQHYQQLTVRQRDEQLLPMVHLLGQQAAALCLATQLFNAC